MYFLYELLMSFGSWAENKKNITFSSLPISEKIAWRTSFLRLNAEITADYSLKYLIYKNIYIYNWL